MINPKLRLILPGIFSLMLYGECILSNPSLGLVSDRYEFMVDMGDLLILSRGDLIIVRDLTDPELLPIQKVFQMPGQVIKLKAEGSKLWALLKDNGIMEMTVSQDSPWIESQTLFSRPDLDVADPGPDVFALGTGALLELYVKQNGSWVAHKTHDFEDEIKKIQLIGTHLTVLLFDGQLFHASFESGVELQFTPISTLAGSVYYNFDSVQTETASYMILDSPKGLVHVDLSSSHQIQSEYFMVQNEGSKVVLSMALFDVNLFVRFPEGIEWYQFENSQWVLRDTLTMSLSEYGIPQFHSHGNTFFMLNANNLPGEWSLLGYDLASKRLFPSLQIATTVNQIKGFVLDNNQLFVAVDNTIYQYPWSDGSSISPDDFEVIQSFPTSILSMVAIPSGFVLSINNLQQNGTDLTFFSTLGGEARQTQTIFFERGVANLKSGSSMLVFSDTEIVGQSKVLTLHLFKLISGEWVEKTYQESIPKEMDFTLKDFTPLLDSVFFIDGTAVYTVSYENPVKQLVYESNIELRALGRVDKTLVVESTSGLLHLNPALQNILMGSYPDWFDLSVTLNSIALVRSKKKSDLGRFDILALDPRQFLYPVSRIETGVAPTHLAIKNLKLLFHTPYSFQEFDYTCPILQHQYIWPAFPNLELDINTNFKSSDLIRWEFWDSSDTLIGRYFLEAESLTAYYGKPLSDWPFSLNENHETQKITVRSSFRLYSVLSGSLNGSDRFSVPFSGDLFQMGTLPHIASSLNGWSNLLFLQFHPFGKYQQLDINWGGIEHIQVPIPESGSGIFQIPEDLSDSESPPWLSLGTEGLNSGFSGFNLFSIGDMSAGIVLENTTSDFFVIPVFPKSSLFGWQGIGVANPYDETMHIRFLGYDASGQIIFDKADMVESLGKLVISADELFPQKENLQVKWMNLVTEQPTTAISVIGTSNNQSIAGFSLMPEFGQDLILPGVRSENVMTWLMLINTESTESETVITAFSQTGDELGKSNFSFGPKATLLTAISDLFPGMDEDHVRQIGTLTLASSAETTGVCIRHYLQSDKIEAFRLFSLP